MSTRVRSSIFFIKFVVIIIKCQEQIKTIAYDVFGIQSLRFPFRRI